MYDGSAGAMKTAYTAGAGGRSTQVSSQVHVKGGSDGFDNIQILGGGEARRRRGAKDDGWADAGDHDSWHPLGGGGVDVILWQRSVGWGTARTARAHLAGGERVAAGAPRAVRGRTRKTMAAGTSSAGRTLT